MQQLDWIILSVTLLSIVIYGVYKTQGSKNVEDYILDNKQTNWWTIGLSVMATQASAITFLSTPGQAYQMEWDLYNFILVYLSLWWLFV